MDFKKRIDELRDEMVSSIQELVKIPSVLSEGDDKYPFGENIDKALRYTLSLCESLGFKVFYGDGYYGYAEIGQGDEMIGILGHLDVVPEGEIDSWKFPPFAAVVNDGKIYGRGTQDDKGPTIAAIYAVKALMDIGFKFNKRVRFIFGTDEENLWRDMKKYIENEEIPSYGFTPDSTFPMINAEKGLLQVILRSKNISNVSFSGGTAFNSVPDKAVYSGEKMIDLAKELDRLGFEYEMNKDSILVTGKSSHAAKPEYGINAICRLFIALKNIGIRSNCIDFVADIIKQTYNGENILPNCEDNASGKLTVNVGKVTLNKDIEEIGLDIRIPVTFDKKVIEDAIKEKAKSYNLEYIEHDFLKAIYLPEDHVLIKTLKDVFEKETGLDPTPLSSGGATYARAIDNCVAFGAVFPGKPKVEHQANEYVVIDDLVKAAKIYASAIYELTKE
ncbi:dipeptidase, putative [Alkalithermobacter thermoalcaliphilus JW-YL-7 = DSM 7308]|uniref:Dipeptidase n=1 Tax=Alkalithermobacter thermoalcaliphilus JW-YL-7 = DSM 7308 TaxID=1121328 RepID=A0A150FMK8_CLOPD|nr:dipeptidase [[Clostridium] paradoxum JW-YL-7 = DSM 7308]SHL21517.1 dipeptidase, putative [[Clostridium] paradoxum JW-YL-7 = DSM 7308]